MKSIRRLELVNSHINSRLPRQEVDSTLLDFSKSSMELNEDILLKHFFDDSLEGIQKFRGMMSGSSLFLHEESLSYSIEDYRGHIMKQLKFLYGSARLSYTKDKENPLEKLKLIYPMAEYDLSLSARLIVHIILYTDTLQSLGTEKHTSIIDKAYSLKDYGCFGMTELGHGSNVSALETTATYDPISGGFVLNSPTATSAKWWIGAASDTANMAVIFAQLIIDNSNKGVHAFAVPIRDYESHNALPGVVIGDCGPKISLNGIDNGFILFQNYKVNYDCLLDKFSQIRDGKFKSSIKNKEKRLGLMMAALIRGRLAVISGSEIFARNCLTIALRYAGTRKQFGPGPEVPIFSYQLHKYRLLPRLGQALAIRCGVKCITRMYCEIRKKAESEPECDELNELHSVLSSVKAISSWFSLKICQECRQACGGSGFSAYASIDRYRGYQEVMVTWEGDNYVLIQQTAKYILKVLQKTFKGQNIVPSTLNFLQFDYEEVKKFKSNAHNQNDFLNENHLIHVLEHKVSMYMHLSVLKLSENSAKASDVTEAWNNSQVFYIQELSKSFGELILAKELLRFCKEIEKDCAKTAKVIYKFFYLYALDRILESISSYMDGAITSMQEKIIKDTILSLCDELAPVSINLVNALSAPDSMLGSAIGEKNGQLYQNYLKTIENYPKVYSKPNWLHLLKEIRNSSF